MFTSIETYSPAFIDSDVSLVASLMRPWNRGAHAEALAGRSLR